MGEVGELLELLHGAGSRWRTVRFVLRQWGHGERAAAAMRRSAERRAAAGGSGGTAFGMRSTGGPPTWEMVTSAWVDRLGDRTRVETSGPSEDRLAIRTRRLWWSYSPRTGSMSNESEPQVGGGAGGELEWLLEPSSLLPELDFTLTGAATVAGRRAVTAVATPRPEDPRRGFGAHISRDADDVLLAVDAERGVLLRAEARLDGAPFALVEMTEVAFDGELPDELFRFVSPDGSPVQSPKSMFFRPEPVSVEEAARRASFTVLAPTRIPEGWTLHATYAPPAPRPVRPESVTIRVLDGAGMQPRAQINESGAPSHDNLAWETVEHGGRRISIVANQAPVNPWEAKLQVGGTYVRASGNLDRNAFLDILASLGPAPTELPPMVER